MQTRGTSGSTRLDASTQEVYGQLKPQHYATAVRTASMCGWQLAHLAAQRELQDPPTHARWLGIVMAHPHQGCSAALEDLCKVAAVSITVRRSMMLRVGGLNQNTVAYGGRALCCSGRRQWLTVRLSSAWHGCQDHTGTTIRVCSLALVRGVGSCLGCCSSSMEAGTNTQLTLSWYRLPPRPTPEGQGACSKGAAPVQPGGRSLRQGRLWARPVAARLASERSRWRGSPSAPALPAQPWHCLLPSQRLPACCKALYL